MIVIMSFDRNAIVRRQVKNWRLEDVRNGRLWDDNTDRYNPIAFSLWEVFRSAPFLERCNGVVVGYEELGFCNASAKA
jgi:hypothetical protein